MATKKKTSLYRWIFHRSRGDSPFVKVMLHITLVALSFIMLYPALRVLTISLRPGNRVLSTSLDIIPTDRIWIPKGFSEQEMQILRERTPEEIQKKFDAQMGKKEQRTIKFKFSGKEMDFAVSKDKMSDVIIERIIYKNEDEIQVVMDEKIAATIEMAEASVYIDTGYDREMISKEKVTTVVDESTPKVINLPAVEGNPSYVPELTSTAYEYAVSQGIVDLRPEYFTEELVQDPYGDWYLEKVRYVKVAPQLRTLNLPISTTWSDIEPLANEQKINDRDNGLLGKNGHAVILLGGNNLVPLDYEIPFKLSTKDLEKRILYAKSGATEFSFVSASGTNYNATLFDTDFFLWIWNSLLITIATSTMGVALASTSAYAFSRFAFPGRRVGLIFLLATQMIPAAMLLLPIYMLAYKLGLIGSWVGLVVAYSVSSIPFSIHILKGYYDTIPKELEEAATIDGATKMQTFFRIMLPLAAPALAIVFLFNFMTAWNDYLLAKIMLNKDPNMHTWPLGLQRLQGQFNTDWGKFSAAALMVSIPVTILFLASSKYLVSGLTLGSVKG